MKTIREYCINLIVNHPELSNQEIKAKVRKHFFGSRTSIANIIFYREEAKRLNIKPQAIAPLHKLILDTFKKV